MSDPTDDLKNIIQNAIDLYSQLYKEYPTLSPEDVVKVGKGIKHNVERLVDMVWYRVDADDWDKKHQGHVRTNL